ncbi:MAG: hypothetical protein H6742_17125 [Alphaproteobacteria bacterium]|nr:hypothetical protein [Alphaproteobacteria bacterium]
MSDLTDEIVAAIEGPADAWTDARFDELARRLFSAQIDAIPAWAALARARGVTAAGVGHWRELPPVPTRAFKRWPLFAGPGAPVHEFHTSGTSLANAPGRALFGQAGLRAMAASIRANARVMLLPEPAAATRILVLAPRPELAPHMIMAHGMAQLVAEHGLPGSRFLVGEGGLDVPGLMGELAASSAGEGPPLTLIGASFGFVHLLDQLEARDTRFVLPAGSRLMDAGGFKGRSREVGYDNLLAGFQARFGLPAERCVNLLGMTELASQLYDNVLRDGVAAPRFKVCPPWVRTEVVDPGTLQPLPVGARGLLRHVDLANVDRPFVVQTDDLGERLPDGPGGEVRFRVFGRATPDGSRGCSITVDEMAGR